MKSIQDAVPVCQAVREAEYAKIYSATGVEK